MSEAMPPSLFCFGLGYSAEHYVASYGGRYARIGGTVRTAEKAGRLTVEGFGGRAADVFTFDGSRREEAIAARLQETSDLLISAAPDANGDPVLRHFEGAIARSPVRAIVYLSTVGVYGDHQGAWVEESAALRPASARNRARIAAEAAWRQLAGASGKRLCVLRLSGIYGPGRNALVDVARGQARRVVKPGQVFNRIHVADIAAAIAASFIRNVDGVFNVTDDEPAPGDAVVAYAASLLGVPPPPAIDFETAATRMTPLAISFYGEVKRVSNTTMKQELGVRLRYPTYREGLSALFDAGDHHTAAASA